MIADASILILFARAGHLDILRRVTGSVEIPDAVHREVFARDPPSPDAQAVQAGVSRGWIRPIVVEGARTGRLVEQYPNLGLGELATLALAREQDQTTVLMDDAAARKVARIHGVRPVGCLGIIARAHKTGILADKTAVARAVRDLVSSGLWVSAEVIEIFWESLGGRP